jgi:hypothetical protein
MRKVKHNLLSTLAAIFPDIPLPHQVQPSLLPQVSDLSGLQPLIVAIIPLRNVIGDSDIQPLDGPGEEQFKRPRSPLSRADKDVREPRWVEELASAHKRRRRGGDLRGARRREINLGAAGVAAGLGPRRLSCVQKTRYMISPFFPC